MANASLFMALDDIIQLGIITDAIYPDDSFFNHMQECAHKRCPKVIAFLDAVQSMRALTHRHDALICSSSIGSLCTNLSRKNLIDYQDNPDLKAKLSQCVSMDIHVLDISIPIAQQMFVVVANAPHLKRLSVSGGIHPLACEAVISFFEQTFEFFAVEPNRAISSLLLDVPLELINNIRGRLDLRTVDIRTALLRFETREPMSWNGLRHMRVVLEQEEMDQSAIVFSLGEDILDELRSLWLSITGPCEGVDFLVEHVGDTITDLGLFFDPFDVTIAGLPECPNLVNLTCNVKSADSLIKRVFPAITHIFITEVAPEAVEEPRVPDVEYAYKLDCFILHLQRTKFLPSLRAISVHPILQEHFYEYAWHLEELKVYAYWGVQSTNAAFRFAFQDAKGELILPKGFDPQIRRSTARYPLREFV